MFIPFKTYIFGLLLQHQLHPLLPEVKEVHDGTEDGQSPLLLWKHRATTITNINSEIKTKVEFGLRLISYWALEGHLMKNRTRDTWAETAT